MTTQVVLPLADAVLDRVASAVRRGLTAPSKSLPPWLFYDEAGSRLFEQITELPEYYLTRVERGILSAYSRAMLTHAGGGQHLRIVELGAGSAAKTRLLLRTAMERQSGVVYEPVDVSFSALESACQRIESDLPEIEILPRVMDYTHELEFEPCAAGERRLVVYIGSSIGNFEPDQAIGLLRRIRSRLQPGDGLLLGVDLVKDRNTLLAAYNDSKGITAAFNLNLLRRLNRELEADFDLESFSHRRFWNAAASRIEMHLESLAAQTVRIEALDLEVEFAAGEMIHTENSYKFPPGGAEALLSAAFFTPVSTWTDPRQWFAVCLGQVE
jgi:L-histidine Nalpha-methyltransferase